AILPERRANHRAVDGGPAFAGLQPRPRGGARRCRTLQIPARAETECGGESRLGRIAELAREIVADQATRDSRIRVHGGRIVIRCEAIAVVAEFLRVLPLELDREIRRTAVVLRIEAVRLAAGTSCRSDRRQYRRHVAR